MHRLRQIPEYNDMEIALSTVEEENKAKKILSENVDKFRNCVASNFEIIDLNADLNRQRSFNSIIACDGSTLRFEKTSGNLEKFAITANRTGTEKRGKDSFHYTGQSQIVAPDMKILSRARSNCNSVHSVSVDLSYSRNKKLHKNNHLIKDRRTKFYK